MYTKAVVMNARPVRGAALVACALFAGSVVAKDQEFTVAYQVSNTRTRSHPACRSARAVFPP